MDISQPGNKVQARLSDRRSFDLGEADGRERNEGAEQIVVLRTVSDMCFLPPQRTLSFVLRSTDGSWSQGRICRYRHIGRERVARRYNASAIQAAGFNVRSEVPSYGYFHVMREVLMYLPGRAMACAG
jgi:hypothetical protein